MNGGVLDFVVTGDVSFLQRAKQAANFVLQNGDIQILSPGTIAGSAWHDLNGDGFWDAGEPALGNWTIYSDLDNDGHLDTGEPSTVTSPTGQYSLNNLSTGLIHNIREKIPSTSWGWWTQTFPSNTLHIIYLSSGQTSAPNNFGNRYFDFLPDPIDLIINDVRVVEGDIAVVAVTLNQSATTAVTVNYAAVFGTGVGNATDADLVTATGAKGVLTFAPGETSKTITIATKNDTTAEVDEKFTINLTNPTGGVTISKATGTVTIADTVTSNVTTVLPTTKTNLILTGSGDINGTGNAVGNIITGNSGNNILNGGAGIDTLIGGNGKDIYVVDTITDTITENANEGTDTIQSSVTFTLATLPNIENLTLTGTAAINGTGNASNNTITGNAANNVLNGGAGNDILNGGAGNDTLNGGAGSDTLTGGAGNDVHVFQFGQSTATAPDRITDFAFGTDKIDLLTSSGLATPTPASFSRAANNTATTLTSVVTSVFADANGALAGLQALGVNSAALVVATNAAIAGTYLVINDGTANFQAANDLVVNLTGYTGTLPALGNITPVTNFFV